MCCVGLCVLCCAMLCYVRCVAVSPSGAVAESSHEELAALINSIMSITNVAFFGLAGASLKLVRPDRHAEVTGYIVLHSLVWLSCQSTAAVCLPCVYTHGSTEMPLFHTSECQGVTTSSMHVSGTHNVATCMHMPFPTALLACP
jgi:hypothetical protein